MNRRRPLGITLLGYLYILSSLLLIVIVVADPIEKSESIFSLSLPNIPVNIQLLIFAIISLIISYGYLTLKKWGYWAMIIYTICCLGLFNFSQFLFIVNIICSIIILVYTFTKRNCFLDKNM